MEAMWFSLVGFVHVGAELGWMVGNAWSWLVVFGLFFAFIFISSFLEESLPFFGKKSLVGIVPL